MLKVAAQDTRLLYGEYVQKRAFQVMNCFVCCNLSKSTTASRIFDRSQFHLPAQGTTQCFCTSVCDYLTNPKAIAKSRGFNMRDRILRVYLGLFWLLILLLYTMRRHYNVIEQTGLSLTHRVNTFANFRHQGPSCQISSLDLYEARGQRCRTRTSMLEAMSTGGRVGRDAPYTANGCDMIWYSTKEVCEILGRFSQVMLVGDSMLRHIIGALNVLIREDLGYGAVTDWNFSNEERLARDHLPSTAAGGG